MEENRKPFWKPLLMWFMVCFCFAGIPSTIVYFSLNQHFSMSEEILKEKLKVELQRALNDCAAAADKEKFWCRKMTEKFNLFARNKSSLEEVQKWLAETRKLYGTPFEFLIWDTKGTIKKITFQTNYSDQEWYQVFLELANSCLQAKDLSWKPPEKADIKKVRNVIGPQFVSEMLEANTHPKLYGFAWPDSSMKKPLLWTYFTDQGGFLLLFPSQKLADNASLKSIIKRIQTRKEFYWGLFEPWNRQQPIWLQKNESDFPSLKSNLEKCERELINFIEDKHYYMATSFLSAEQRIFVCSRREFTSSQKRLKSLLGAFILFVLMTPFFTYTYKTIVKGVPGTVSIRARLAFLFFFANAMPFLAMTIVSQEYYLQKRDSLLKEVHKRSIELLKDYDKRLESTYSKFEYNVQVFFDAWAAGMKNPVLTNETNKPAIDAARKTMADSYFLISSSSAYVGSYSGVKKVEETLAVQEEKSEKTKNKTKQQHTISNSDANNSQLLNLIGKRIMNELNGVSKSNQATTKLEILAESIMQKSFAEITHSFIKAMGGISAWGFGKTQNLTLLKFMSLPNSSMVDYMAVVLWNSKTVQQHYVESTIININRNPIGLKVFARLEFTSKYYPSNFKPDEACEAYMEKATERPNEEIETINYEGEEHMAICFIGQHLERYRILGLYPVPKLAREIGREKNALITLGILSILLGLLLAQILSKSFLQPLNSLQDAALAIENRNFQLRVKNIGKDEFGEIGTIFNNVMVGLEELEVAKVVQESLFPENYLTVGDFRIYGRSITMAELGGDYYDFFPIETTSCGVLMGDVAGHGVGAALIMAMAKSGILSSETILNEPQKLLEGLHDLIYSSKTRKQKKIMTFQYVCVDTQTGVARYSNAGACSPIFVENCGKKGREISLPGAALGAFKKAKLGQIEICFKPGDVLVFYTDGIIEARSPEGKEMGYPNFMKLVQESWDPNPQIIYEKLLNAYLKHIGGQDAEDDLTLIVMVFSPPQLIENNLI